MNFDTVKKLKYMERQYDIHYQLAEAVQNTKSSLVYMDNSYATLDLERVTD